MSQQQGAELSPPLLRRLVEGGKRPLVCGVDARVVLDQQGGNIHVLDGRGRIGRTQERDERERGKSTNCKVKK